VKAAEEKAVNASKNLERKVRELEADNRKLQNKSASKTTVEKYEKKAPTSAKKNRPTNSISSAPGGHSG
jgi:hypothetical protein